MFRNPMTMENLRKKKKNRSRFKKGGKIRLQLNYNSKAMSLKSQKKRTLPGNYHCNEGRRTAHDIVEKTKTNKVVLRRTVENKHGRCCSKKNSCNSRTRICS